MIETEKTNYGNWIPRTFMTLCYSAVALLLAIELGLFFASVGTVVLWLVGVVLLLALLFTLYMQVCRWLFSFTGRGLMGKFHEYLLAHLDWDGHGQMLDIGCGAAALTVRCAHTYPQAQITGIDYWDRVELRQRAVRTKCGDRRRWRADGLSERRCGET